MFPHNDLTFPNPGPAVLAGIPSRETGLQVLWSTFAGQPFFGVCLFQGGRFLYANERMAQLLGYTVDEIIALPSVFEVIHEQDMDAAREGIRALLEGAAGQARLALKARRKDSSQVDLEVVGLRVMHDDRPAILSVQYDVTERVAEDRRHEAEALHALATRVAHDFNNVLAAIGTTAQVMEVEHRTQAAADIDEIIRAVRRGTGLCRRLMKLGSDDPHLPT